MKTSNGIATLGLLTMVLAGCPQSVDNGDGDKNTDPERNSEGEGGNGGSDKSDETGGTGGSDPEGSNAGDSGNNPDPGNNMMGGDKGDSMMGGDKGDSMMGGNAAGMGGGMGNVGGMGGMGGMTETPDAAPPPAAALSWEEDIHPIFAMNCKGCHGKQFEQADGAYNRLMGDIGAGCSGKRIEPGNGKDSLVVQFMLGTQKCGPGNRMPKVGMRACRDAECVPMADIEKVIKWIDDGAKKE